MLVNELCEYQNARCNIKKKNCLIVEFRRELDENFALLCYYAAIFPLLAA